MVKKLTKLSNVYNIKETIINFSKITIQKTKLINGNVITKKFNKA